MGTVSKRTFIAGVAAAALLSGGGAVLLTAPEGSAGEGSGPSPTFEMGYAVGGGGTVAVVGRGGPGMPVPPPPPGAPMMREDSAVAEYLGMTPEELFKARASGKSLAEIAADQGKSVDGLKEVLTKQFTDHLDDMINAEGPVFEHHAGGPGPMVFEHHGGPPPFGFGPPPFADDSAILDYLGITREELFKARRDGKSLAQIAEDEGKSVDGLKTAMIDAAKKRLDEAVAAKKLTQDEADKFLAELTDHVDEIVNSTGPMIMGGHVRMKLKCDRAARRSGRAGHRAKRG